LCQHVAGSLGRTPLERLSRRGEAPQEAAFPEFDIDRPAESRGGMPFDDGGSETGSFRLTDGRSADFFPTEAKQNLGFPLTGIFPIHHSIFPTEPDPALRHGK